MNDEWQALIDRNFERLLKSREARGYVQTPSPPWLSKLIVEMPNLYLAAVENK